MDTLVPKAKRWRLGLNSTRKREADRLVRSVTFLRMKNVHRSCNGRVLISHYDQKIRSALRLTTRQEQFKSNTYKIQTLMSLGPTTTHSLKSWISKESFGQLYYFYIMLWVLSIIMELNEGNQLPTITTTTSHYEFFPLCDVMYNVHSHIFIQNLYHFYKNP